MPQNNTRSLVHTVALILASTVVGMVLLTVAVALPAQAQAAPLEVACGTDYECALFELDLAAQAELDIYEDLSFAGSSSLYSAQNDLVADRFWADHAGQDWSEAELDLRHWIQLERSC